MSSALTDPSPWDPRTPVRAHGAASGDVTLVEGQTFCISDRAGDMWPDLPHGLFFLDTRVLSRLELRLDGHRLESVGVDVSDPFAATFAARGAPAGGRADAEIVVFRERRIGRGLRERLSVTNFGLEAANIHLEMFCEVDFADLFEVKESRVTARPENRQWTDSGRLVFDGGPGPDRRQAALTLSTPATVEPGRAHWELELGPGERWELCAELQVEVGGEAVQPRFRCGGDEDHEAVPNLRLASWRARLPRVSTDHSDLDAAIARAGEDLGALRIFDPDRPDVPILAAGAPWFMTVFGRDSLLTAWMTLSADPSLAQGVLETLARFQGSQVDDATEEEPGKILHEMRFGTASGLALGGGHVYYGSIDATPLFVMLLGELRRWGLADELVEQLLPHADRALAWIEGWGDRDGDGYVEYERRSPHGLVNQGWKDSWDAIRFADGTLAEPPIALCEVQGYVYAAYLARAHFAQEAGDGVVRDHYRGMAQELRRRFNEDFWLDDEGTYALGLDRDKRPIDAVTSNVGHCLWTGIISRDRAPAVADRLLAPDMFSGWGIRTLSTTMAAYNPVSYHNGSVWPHDNAICAAGLARYGATDHAHRVIDGQLAAARCHNHRLPELFAGFPREDLAVPGSYPASCSPQAWAAAAPLLWLRTLLRLDPWVPHGRAWVAPVLPRSVGRLSAHGIRVGGSDLLVDVERRDEGIHLRATLSGLDLVREPRPPLTALIDSRS
ncbi:MAG: glycogen debranching N-terminal domain-containing protein [Acidimicrobiales bacterium]